MWIHKVLPWSVIFISKPKKVYQKFESAKEKNTDNENISKGQDLHVYLGKPGIGCKFNIFDLPNDVRCLLPFGFR